MNIKELFFNENKQIRIFWRILIFILLISLAILPLTLINNSYLQFVGAVFILIFGLYINSKYLDKRSFSEYGLVFKIETFSNLLIGILIGVFSVILILLIGKITGIIIVSDHTSTLKLSLISLFAFKMFLVSILEETFFRGYLYTNLYDGFKSKKTSQKMTFLISLLISSVMFGLAHFSNNNASIHSIVLLTINGIVWCIPFAITKNLGLSIGLHFAWNFTQTLLGFTMSGNKAINSLYIIENQKSDLLSGGEYGPEAGFLGLIGFITMLLLSFAYLKIKQKKRITTLYM
ncbi:CPBP family intramembrane glutamic endopeptidase [Aquimarina sp. 2201CG14-23]|uniref:CPBP family intramembrane glutamic endopeptidase n=1 Tax=Aquimarina mycalae TaxID=3040073 RepID=UPI002477D93D|nr:CPBP family intramembrane glutamic endopeptidase [Aquimarina sp. 2201CG14-23]MDH7447827.1 CPBP family intramembrane metalloprotease [Aquimarina sp. 2201CG14-23]